MVDVSNVVGDKGNSIGRVRTYADKRPWVLKTHSLTTRTRCLRVSPTTFDK